VSRHPSRAVPAASALQPLKSRNRATKTRHVDNSRQRRVGKPASVGGEPGGTSASIHGLGYLFSALRRERLIADELVLQLATFLRSLDLFLELTVRTVPRTLTANQVPSHDVRGIGTSLTPSAQIEPRLSNAKRMILRSEGAMRPAGAKASASMLECRPTLLPVSTSAPVPSS
jgi:hypothetical protein